MFNVTKNPIYLPFVGPLYMFENDYISNFVLENGHWEKGIRDIFDQYVLPSSIVFDIGAHIGTHSIYLSSIAQQVHSFEPVKPTYDVLRRNILLNHRMNIFSYPIALGDSKRTMDEIFLPLHIENTGCARLEACGPSIDKGYPMKIEMERLDDWIQERDIPRIDVMKIDAEGYETHILNGGRETILRHRPVIIMENFHPEIDLLVEWGYSRTFISNYPFVSDYLYVY